MSHFLEIERAAYAKGDKVTAAMAAVLHQLDNLLCSAEFDKALEHHDDAEGTQLYAAWKALENAMGDLDDIR